MAGFEVITEVLIFVSISFTVMVLNIGDSERSMASGESPTARVELRSDVLLGHRSPRRIWHSARASIQLDLPHYPASCRGGIFTSDTASSVRAGPGSSLGSFGLPVSSSLAVAFGGTTSGGSRAFGNHSHRVVLVWTPQNSIHVFFAGQIESSHHLLFLADARFKSYLLERGV